MVANIYVVKTLLCKNPHDTLDFRKYFIFTNVCGYNIHFLSPFCINGNINIVLALFETKQSWRDERMVWDPAAFEGINLVVMHVDEIWTPKIFLSNS